MEMFASWERGLQAMHMVELDVQFHFNKAQGDLLSGETDSHRGDDISVTVFHTNRALAPCDE
jgi:hypothetical protein